MKEDIDKSVIELLVDRLPIGIWPIVRYKKWISDELQRFVIQTNASYRADSKGCAL